jgi:hypothetical protein
MRAAAQRERPASEGGRYKVSGEIAELRRVALE